MHAVPSQMMIALRRPAAVWLALCIALLGALVPTLSRALVWAQGGAPLVYICTTTDQRWVALQQTQADVTTRLAHSPDAPDAPASVPGLVHCPFCLLLVHHIATPPRVAPAPFVLPGQTVPPLRWQVFLPPPLLAAFVPPPRGPPTILSF